MHCQHEYRQWYSTADSHEYVGAVLASRPVVGSSMSSPSGLGGAPRDPAVTVEHDADEARLHGERYDDLHPDDRPSFRGVAAGFPVFQYSPYRTHKKIDNPTVIDGNVIWNNTVMANCRRERSSRLNAASRNTCGL